MTKPFLNAVFFQRKEKKMCYMPCINSKDSDQLVHQLILTTLSFSKLRILITHRLFMQTKMTDHTEKDLGSYDTFSCDNVYFKTTNYFVRPFIPYVYMQICSLTLLHSTILSAKRLMDPINVTPKFRLV